MSGLYDDLDGPDAANNDDLDEAATARKLAATLEAVSGGYSGILLGFRDITITSGLQTD